MNNMESFKKQQELRNRKRLEHDIYKCDPEKHSIKFCDEYGDKICEMTCNYGKRITANLRAEGRRLPKITAKMMVDFEKEIADTYESGIIYSPVHLSGGNEEPLIEIFKNIEDKDWVFSNHRAHYHSLLKSKNPEWLKQEIIDNKSLHLNSKKYKIFTSAIVGGQIPIALGAALGIKHRGGDEQVYCFLGDMAAEMGCFNEAHKYAVGHDLPITFIVEDNEVAVYTPTCETWPKQTDLNKLEKVLTHKYERIWPHYGVGKFINF